MSDLPKRVRIREVGPREGFQFEKGAISLADKVSLVDALSDTGVGTIEFTSFVSPKWVPQMADAEQVVAGIRRAPGVAYEAIWLNEAGLRRAPRVRGGAGARAPASSARSTSPRRSSITPPATWRRSARSSRSSAARARAAATWSASRSRRRAAGSMRSGASAAAPSRIRRAPTSPICSRRATDRSGGSPPSRPARPPAGLAGVTP